jgi:hypothetical protein
MGEFALWIFISGCGVALIKASWVKTEIKKGEEDK